MAFWQYTGQPQGKLSFKTLWPSLLTFSIGTLIALFLWHALELQSSAHLYRIISIQTEHVTKNIHTQLEIRISALKHMAKHLEALPVKNYPEWEESVAAYLNDYAGFQAIAWVDSKLKIHWTAPANIDVFPGLFANFIQHHASEIKSTSAHRQIWLSKPVTITEDEKGMFVVVPLSGKGSQPFGYLISVINLKNLFNIQLNTDDFDISIYDGDEKIYQFGTDITDTEGNWSFVRTLSLYGSNWRIDSQPTAHLLSTFSSPLPVITLFLGIFIALLFAIAIRLIQINTMHAKSLDHVNQDLKNEISVRIHMEETKQKLEKALLQGQKLQAIGTLAGGIAHDFNNILYAIIGYTQMAREDSVQDDNTHKNLGKVLTACKRGQELVARILAFSRRQHHEFKPLLIKETLAGVLSLLKPTIPASVQIDCQFFVPNDAKILGNETQLHQVFVNIINNAVDAMDGEGVIKINIDTISVQDELLQHLPNKIEQRYCKIEISDAGHGMDQATLGRIFEPFFTTKEVGKGTGLGLSMVHAIIKEHNGEILVNSQLGGGSTFIILLPEYQPRGED